MNQQADATISNILGLTFWRPANAFGQAVTLRYQHASKPVLLNFYWSGMELSAQPRIQSELESRINSFISQHPPVDPKGRSVFHIQSVGDEFYEIQDPGWVPVPVHTPDV